jgi:hypothetical protein
VVNPLTNRIFVNNGGEASLTIIDGATDANLTPTPLAVGSQGPMAINAETNIVYIVRMTSVATDEVTFFNAATNNWYTIATESFQPGALTINPVTNTLYVAHYGTGDVRVISGEFNNTNLHPATTSIGAWSKPFAIAANSMTNRVYVITEDSRGPIGVINGATNAAVWPTPAAGHASAPKALAVNPVTNKVYAAFANEVIVIDGADNSLAYVPVTTGTTASIAINYFTNKIYVASDGGSLTVIDGATNATTSLSVPAGTLSIGMNPTTNEVITGGGALSAVNGVAAPSVSVPLTTTINALPGNSGAASASITMSAANGFANPLPVRGVYYQFDSIEGRWSLASGSGNGPWTAPLSGLTSGSHTIYAFAAEAHASPTDTGNGSSPLFGNIASYAFTVTATTGTARVNLASSANPSSAGQAVTFTASVSGSAATPTGSVAFVDGTTTLCPSVTLASGSATCTTSSLAGGSHTISANYSGDANYAAASGSLVQTVSKVTPMVTGSASPNPAEVGTAVTLTAILAGTAGAPTGTVDFLEGTAAVAGCSARPISGDRATCTLSSLAGGNHSLTARYAGNATYNAATSAAFTVTITCATCPPSAPTLIAPSGTITTQTPAYSWNASPGATSYYLLVQNTQGVAVGLSLQASSLGCGAGTGTCSVTPATALVNNTSYVWFVNATNANGTGAWSAGKDIFVSAAGPGGPPSAPTPVSPSGTINTTTPTYSWNASAGATAYYLLVQNTQGVAVSMSIAASDAGCASGGTCSIMPSTPLANNSMYNWFVNASNAQGTSAWSGAMQIQVSASGPAEGPPPAPSLVSPDGTVNTTTPTYTWNAAAGATSYYLLVQNTAGVAVSMAVDAVSAGCSGGGMCSITPTNALANGATYSWFVNASNRFGTSAWSAGKSVTPNAAAPSVPATPTTLSPSGATSRTPTYTWNASAGATSYYLLVQNTSGVAVSMSVAASAAGCGGGTGTCSVTPATTLAAASSYAWFVNASNSVGTSAWSDGRMISTP